MTFVGSAITSLVCLAFFFINYASMTLLMKCIKYLTLLKILIPIIVAVILLVVAHNFSNLGITTHSFYALWLSWNVANRSLLAVLFCVYWFSNTCYFCRLCAKSLNEIFLWQFCSLCFLYYNLFGFTIGLHCGCTT